MTDIKPYTPLKQICSYALDECDKSFADFDKVWILGLRGLVDINYDVSAKPKTMRIPVSPNKTVPLPPDYMSWNKIGILDENGEINTLKINNALTTFRDNNPNRLQDLTPDINDGVGQVYGGPFYYNYFYGGECYNLFGVGGGVVTYGECRVDERNRVIVLNPEFRYDSILIEYMSAPERDEDYNVPTAFQEAIIAFIKWKLKLGSPQDFYAEVIKGRRRLSTKKVSLQSINQILRESESQKLRS